jgi:hypothetical protein
MRAIVRCIAGVALALSVAGCNGLEFQYFRQGIGTDFYTPELPGSTALADAYVAYICRQAGLAREGETCDDPSLGRQWAAFVQAGMNDIDRRCDGYLAWLDDRKRSQTPILNQLHALSATTIGIMNATGVGANPITIVGLAFGLAADTFTNVQSRLVLEANHSAVQAVVLGNQSQYRAQVISKAVDNKPAAIYLLRGYLRICMPFSIETSMNNTLTVFHRSGSEALDQPALFQRPALIPAVSQVRVLRESIPRGPREQLPGAGGQEGPKPEPKVTGAQTDVERKLPISVAQQIQSNLCVSVADGNFGAETREAIRQAKIAARQSAQALTTPPPFNNIDGEIKSNLEVQMFADARNCSKDSSGVERGYLTAFEKFGFPGPVAINELKSRLKACNRNLNLPDSQIFDQPTRTAIMTIKANAPASEKARFGDPNSGGLNNQSYSYILRTCVL